MNTLSPKYFSIYLLAFLLGISAAPLGVLLENGQDSEVTWMEGEEKGEDNEKEEKELDELEKYCTSGCEGDVFARDLLRLFQVSDPTQKDILLDVPIPPPERV